MWKFLSCLLIGTAVYASENQPKKEKRILLKEGENLFTISKGTFPFIDSMIEDLGIPSQALELPQVNRHVTQSTITNLQHLADTLTSLNPNFIKNVAQLSEDQIYTLSNNVAKEIEKQFPLTTPPQDFIDLAMATDYFEALGLKKLILITLSDRLIAGGAAASQTINVPEIDSLLAQIVINKALMKGTELKIKIIPLRDNNSIYEDSAVLCPTASKKGSMCVSSTFFSAEQLRINIFYKIIEEHLPFASWMRYNWFDEENFILSSDCSSDLLYHVSLLKEQQLDNEKANNQPPRFFLKIRNLQKNGELSYNLEMNESDTVGVVFENEGHTFFLKKNDSFYKLGTVKLLKEFSTALLNENKIDINTVTDPFIKKYLDKDVDLNKACRCLCQNKIPTELFDTRILHTLTYRKNILATIKKELNNDKVELVQTSCNYDGYTHTLLLSDPTPGFPPNPDYDPNPNRNRYYLLRVSFEPDTRMQSLIQTMNTLSTKMKFDEGYKYANALCAYHLYTNNWEISAEELKKKMGALYAHVHEEIKKQARGQISIAARKIYSSYMPFVKRHLGLLKYPLIAAAAEEIWQKPILAFIIPATYYVASTLWNTTYTMRHRLSAAQIKRMIVEGTALGMLGLIPVIYLLHKNSK